MSIKIVNNEIIWSSGKAKVIYSGQGYCVTEPCTFGNVKASRKLDWGVWFYDHKTKIAEWLGEFASRYLAEEYVWMKEQKDDIHD